MCLYLRADVTHERLVARQGEKAQDVMYVNWLGMARAGVEALRFYLPEKKKWGQAHMQVRAPRFQMPARVGPLTRRPCVPPPLRQARFAILQVLLEAGQDFVQLLGEDPDAPAGEGEGADEGKRHMYVALDRAKIHSVGMPAIGAFLQKLQVYKVRARRSRRPCPRRCGADALAVQATNNVAAGRAMYEKYTSVPESMLTLRDIVIENRKPRPMFVQASALRAVSMPALPCCRANACFRHHSPTPAWWAQRRVARLRAWP